MQKKKVIPEKSKILFITLSNVGDVILSLPALDSLIAAYPKAEITVLCGRRAEGLFEGNFYIKKCIVYNNKNFFDRLKLLFELKKDKYELVVDLKNSALPLFLKARHKTYPWFCAPQKTVHMKDRHLYKVSKFIRHPNLSKEPVFLFRKSLYISNEDRKVRDDILNEALISGRDKFIIIACGGRSHIKRWPSQKFAELAQRLIEELKAKIAIVGDKDDLESCSAVKSNIRYPVVDLCARTSLKELASFIERADLVISNDSAVMHLASYLDRPTLSIFGPTNDKKYGPWSSRSKIVRSNLFCSPCEMAQCKLETLECMESIGVDEVYAAAKDLFQ